MKAIQVKYLGPTNNRGSRWKAWVHGGANVTLRHDYTMNSEENARCAAHILAAKLAWCSPITGSGALPNGDYVFTISP